MFDTLSISTRKILYWVGVLSTYYSLVNWGIERLYNTQSESPNVSFLSRSWIFCYGFIPHMPQTYKTKWIFEWFYGLRLTLRESVAFFWYPGNPQDWSCCAALPKYKKESSYYFRECSQSFRAADINSGKMGRKFKWPLLFIVQHSSLTYRNY